MRIRDNDPKWLEQALRIVLLAEANTVERVIVEAVEAPAKVKEYKVRTAIIIEEATVAAVMWEPTGKDDLEKRCERMCEVMEMLVKNCAMGKNTNLVNRIHAMPLLGAAELEDGLHGHTDGGRMTAEESNDHYCEEGCYETAEEEPKNQCCDGDAMGPQRKRSLINALHGLSGKRYM